MVVKAVLLCVHAIVIQSITAQCIGAYNGLAAEGLARSNPPAWEAASPWGAPLANPWSPAFPWGAPGPCAIERPGGYTSATLAASNGGGLAVTSISPIAPTGVSVTSENAYDGALAVSGTLPFLGAVALEGALPTAGVGTVTYGCGNGNVGMVSEVISGYNAIGPVGPLGYPGPPGPLSGPYGYNEGRFGYGSCGALY